MTEWEPATDAEAAMRDALRAGDQELYFRILSRTELLLPISADASAGRAPLGWGTWTTGGRTHVLAFTSPAALNACLAEHAGSFREVVYHELAATWPNLEWWLAVDPGLPIEGYLPAWFVAQLARGDVRLPGHAPAEGDPGAAPAHPQPAHPQPAEAPQPAATAGPTHAPGPTHTPGPTHPAGAPAGTAASPAPAFGGPAAASAGPPAAYAPPAAPPAAARSAVAPASPGAPGAPPGTPAGPLAAPALPPSSGPATTRPPVPAAPAPAGPPATPGGQPPAPAGQPPAPVPAAAARPAVAGGGPAGVPQAPGGPLPRRPVPHPGNQPPTMAAAAQALSANALGAAQQPQPYPASPSPDETRTGPGAGFTPANEIEENLLAAVQDGSTESFLSTLLLARVLVPTSTTGTTAAEPGQPGFGWHTEKIDGEQFVVVFTSPERVVDHLGEPGDTVQARFVQLIRGWPDPSWSFAVNPGTPVGATLPGNQILALANWAAEVGLGDDDAGQPAAVAAERGTDAGSPARDHPHRPTVMQKIVPPQHVDFYLDRGYDRVSGFVHRASEVEHLRNPGALYRALGLAYAGSPFRPDADEVYVLRWPAYRPTLYRIPYGGQNEGAMRAMEGWVIERAPFRGNGFAAGDSDEVVAEFKVDSVRLPHGAQLWRIGADGAEKLTALFDSDGPLWRRVGEQ